MRAKTIAAESTGELARALDRAKGDGMSPTLAVVFASVVHDLEEVRTLFAQTGIQVFGCSSAGEIAVDHAAQSEESVREQAIVAMLLDVDSTSYRLCIFDAKDSSYAAGEEAGRWARDAFSDPALVVVASGLMTDGEQVVRGILSQAGPDVPLFGGIAGDDLKLQNTFVFTHDALSADGVLALAFDHGRVEVRGVATSGWAAVGAEKTITSATGNVVHTIDGAPALDVYKDYLGLAYDTDVLISEYPLQIDRGDYSVLRAAMHADTRTRALIFAGTVPEGARVRFSCSPGTQIMDEALAEAGRFRQRVPAADALLLFSCKARHLALGPMAEDEVRPLQQLWGVPTVGFYTYGEIGRNPQGVCDFHNETCVLVTLKER